MTTADTEATIGWTRGRIDQDVIDVLNVPLSDRVQGAERVVTKLAFASWRKSLTRSDKG